jgi:hypothetical protein
MRETSMGKQSRGPSWLDIDVYFVFDKHFNITISSRSSASRRKPRRLPAMRPDTKQTL